MSNQDGTGQPPLAVTSWTGALGNSHRIHGSCCPTVALSKPPNSSPEPDKPWNQISKPPPDSSWRLGCRPMEAGDSSGKGTAPATPTALGDCNPDIGMDSPPPTTPAALGECNPDIGKDSPPPAKGLIALIGVPSMGIPPRCRRSSANMAAPMEPSSKRTLKVPSPFRCSTTHEWYRRAGRPSLSRSLASKRLPGANGSAKGTDCELFESARTSERGREALYGAAADIIIDCPATAIEGRVVVFGSKPKPTWDARAADIHTEEPPGEPSGRTTGVGGAAHCDKGGRTADMTMDPP
mmetsp:Transcript_11913/g.27113  ORF Transcript_11913/g.27113 Transcript_11913/m.27113 type:complete len:295 (+) Transcript_11913:538-1422(+)